MRRSGQIRKTVFVIRQIMQIHGGKRNADQYPQQIKELTMYLHDLTDDKHRFPNLTAAPHISTAPDVWLLGSSGESALLAAESGAGYMFAHFINGEGQLPLEAYLLTQTV